MSINDPERGVYFDPKTPTHSPLPWKLTRYTNYEGFSIEEANWHNNFHGCIAERWEENPKLERAMTIEANAKFIVRACNSHYELLEACKFMLSEMIKVEPCSDLPEYEGYKKIRDILEQALQKAEGKA